MDNCVEHLFVFEGNGKVKDFNGTYTEYRLNYANTPQKTEEKPKTDLEPVSETPEITKTTEVQASKRKLSYNEQRELTTIEKELPQLEAEKEKLSMQLTGNLSFDEIQKISDDLKKVVEKIDHHTERWLELSE
jgi:ATP-binding cassette subfamily F protein uup